MSPRMGEAGLVDAQTRNADLTGPGVCLVSTKNYRKKNMNEACFILKCILEQKERLRRLSLSKPAFALPPFCHQIISY